MQLRNINPLGYVDVPLLGREGPAYDSAGQPTEPGSGCLVPDEVFECTDEQGAALLEQVGNYEAVPSELDKLTIPQLQEYATARSIDLTGLTKKADIITAIEKG